MKLLVLASALLSLVPAASVSGPSVNGDPMALCGYKLVWSDEFDEQSISAWRLGGKRWIAHTPWAGDFGEARFTDPGSNGPFETKDGILRITARRGADGRWTSGLISGGDETGAGAGLRYGYFEARMRMPAGPGTWPAFWLMSLKPRSDPRPSVEFDGLEFYGHDPASYYAAWHVHYKPPGEKLARGDLMRIRMEPGLAVNKFNTIGVLVTPETVTYLFNRVPVWRHPTPPELDTPLFPLADLALGSGYPIDQTPNPSVLEIDYVRIFAPVRPGEKGTCVGGELRRKEKRR